MGNCNCSEDRTTVGDEIANSLDERQKLKSQKQTENQFTIQQQFKKKKLQSGLRNVKVRSSKLITNSGQEVGLNYKYGNLVGQGTNSEVIKVQNKKTGEIRAMKRIDREYKNLDNKEKGLIEIETLKKLDHPNINKLIEYYLDQRFVYIIMDYHQGGDLLKNIENLSYFSEQHAAKIMKQILQGIDYLHKNQIMHRDIKPEKIILELENSIDQLKLIGFGESCEIKQGKVYKELVGTPYYVSPEVIKGKYNEKCDLWSSGVVLAAMLTGNHLFSGDSVEEVIENIQNLNYNLYTDEWDNISEQCKNFLEKLLCEQDQRISAEDALKDPWIISNQVVEDLNLPNLSKQLKNLKNYRKGKVLSEAIHGFVVENLITATEKQELLRTFTLLDTNGDGKLSRQEILDGFSKVDAGEISQDVLNQIFLNIDDNQNGCIDFTEWTMATINQRKILSKDRLQKAFSLFDQDNNGLISVKELKSIFTTDGETNKEVWDELVQEFDQNMDGEISLKEFTQTLQKKFQEEPTESQNIQEQSQSIESQQ